MNAHSAAAECVPQISNCASRFSYALFPVRVQNQNLAVSDSPHPLCKHRVDSFISKAIPANDHRVDCLHLSTEGGHQVEIRPHEIVADLVERSKQDLG